MAHANQGETMGAWAFDGKRLLGAAILLALFLGLGMPAHAQMASYPTSVSFPSQSVGSISAPVTVYFGNADPTNTIVVVSISSSAGQFSYSGPALPVAVGPGQYFSGSLTFSPSASQSYDGSLIYTADDGSQLNVPISGLGTGYRHQWRSQSQDIVQTLLGLLTLNTQALNFGSVNIGGGSTQTITVSNSGTADMTVSNVVVSGAGFSASGISSGLIIPAGQSAVLTVGFNPAGAGNVAGSVTIVTDSGTTSVTLSGTGSDSGATSHSVTLSWNPSSSDVVGYNTYSSTISGGPYNKLTNSLVPATTYVDSSAQGGQTYYYVVTSVDSNNDESAYSNETSANVPQ